MAVTVSRRRTIEPAHVGLAGLVGLAAVTATLDDGPVVCGFRLCTGGYCPGCGGSRAAVALLRGDAVGAWHHHPWVVLIALQIAALAAARAVSGRASFPLRAVLYANLVLGLAIWMHRLASGAIPTPF